VGDVLFNLRASLCFLAQVRQDQSDAKTRENEEEIMDLLWTLAVILLILWILGLVTSYTLGGFIHLLLVVAIIVILLRVIQGRKPIP
jgi:predicted ferric reductase